MISMSLCRENIYPEFPESSGRAPESPHGTGSDCARGRRWHWGSKVLCCSEPICELPIANATWLIRCGIRWEIIPVLIIESYDPFLMTLVLWPTMALVSTNAVPAGGAWTLLFEQCPNNHMPLSWSFSLDTFGWLNSIELPIFNIPPNLQVESRCPRGLASSFTARWGDGAEDLCGFPAGEHHRRWVEKRVWTLWRGRGSFY